MADKLKKCAPKKSKATPKGYIQMNHAAVNKAALKDVLRGSR
jgi:hypothetical protein